MDHFIGSLRDEVRILKELPPRLKKRVELGMYHEMPPISWSNMSYYQNQVNFQVWSFRLRLVLILLLIVLYLNPFTKNFQIKNISGNRFFPW